MIRIRVSMMMRSVREAVSRIEMRDDNWKERYRDVPSASEIGLTPFAISQDAVDPAIKRAFAFAACYQCCQRREELGIGSRDQSESTHGRKQSIIIRL